MKNQINQIRYKIRPNVLHLDLGSKPEGKTQYNVFSFTDKITWVREKEHDYLVDILEVFTLKECKNMFSGIYLEIVKIRIYCPNEKFVVGWEFKERLTLHYDGDIFDGRFNLEIPTE